MATGTEVIEGRGAVARVGELLRTLGVMRPLVIVDRPAAEASGAIGVVARLERATLFDGVRPNPSVEDAVAGASAARAAAADGVLAVGGGSALDLAKTVVALVGTNADPFAVAAGRAPLGDAIPPLVAVPTTAGTGSEATHFAVVWVRGTKHSLADVRLRPSGVVLDAALTDGLPPAVTAATGLDALCQAAESAWSVGATDASLEDALAALRLAWQNLETAVRAPTPTARDAMLHAAHRAGRAIDLTKTTAPHALSYAMTADHGVPHGHAVALTFGAVLEHNAGVTEADCVDHRGATAVRERIGAVLDAMGAADGADGRERFEALLARLGLATRLAGVGIASAAARAAIVSSVNVERLANNPRRLAPAELAAIVESVA